MSVSSYDPSDDERPAAPSRPRTQRRRSGPKKPKNWLPASAREEDPENPDHVPQPLNEEQRRKLRDRCMSLCLWHLGQGPRTVQQLREAMAKHQAPEDIIEATLAQVAEYGYVDDARFAADYVRTRTEHQRRGPRRIQQELRRKGVPAEQISEALSVVGEDTETANARALVAKKLRSSQGLDRQKRTNRLVAMLARQGYSGAVAYAVVREALDAEAADGHR